MKRALLVALAIALALAPPPVRAQQELPALPTLERADSLASAGRTEQAREALMKWWEGEADVAPREAMQRALWLRGLLTVDPHQASLDYQRLVVEYPGGPFSDGALLRLAQAARAAGHSERALGLLRTLVRDYPSSPNRLRARALLDEVEAGVGPAVPPRPSARVTRGGFAIQLGAFSSPEGARTLLDRARAAGLDPRLVRVAGSDLVRVRTGRFVTEEAAQRRGEAIRALGFDALEVGDAGSEREVP